MAPISDSEIDALYEQYVAANQPTAPTISNEDVDSLYAKYVADNTGSSTGRTVAGGLQNLTNALTFGFGDEIVAGGNALIDALPFVGNDASMSENYDRWLALSRSTRDQFRQEHKPTALLMDIGGAVATPGFGLVKGATGLMPKIGAMAKEGAVFGGLQGFGDSEGDLLNRLEGGATGATLAAALSPVTGSALYGLDRAARPFTAGGQERAAKEILETAAGKDGVARIMTDAPELAGEYGPRTFAEIARTPGAANLEMAMRKELGDTGGNELLGALAERQTKRVSALNELAPDAFQGVQTDARGSLLRAGAIPINKAADDAVQGAWDVVKKGEVGIPINEVAARTLNVAGELENVLGYSGKAQKVLGALEDISKQDAQEVTVKTWQSLRSAAGEVMTDAAADGRNQEAAVMKVLRDSLDNAADTAVGSGNLSSANLKNLRTAIGKTRSYMETFESGVPSQITQRGEKGFRLGESAIPQKVISTPEAAKSFMKAYGHNKEMVEQARGALLDRMAKKNTDTWERFFNDNRPQFKAIFGEDFLTVKKVIDDLGSEESVKALNQLGTGRGSITTQGINTKGTIRESIGNVMGNIPGGVGAGIGLASGFGAPGVIVGALAGKGIDTLEKAGQEQIKKIIVQALRNPETAKEILSKSSTGKLGDLLPLLTRYSGAQSGSLASSRSYPNVSRRAEEKQRSKEMIASLASRQSSTTGQGQAIQSPQQTSEIPYQNYNPGASATQLNKQPVKYTRESVKQMTDNLHPFLRAVVKTESAGNPNAVSRKGATGLMQLMPATAREVAGRLGLENYDITDPETNLALGTRYLQEQIEEFKDPELALAAYNAGPEKVKEWQRKYGKSWNEISRALKIRGHYSETVNYVPTIMRRFRNFATA